MTSVKRRIATSATGIGLLVSLLPTAVAAADPVTETFAFTPDEQIFVVPNGVLTIHVVLVGGRGGDMGGCVPGGQCGGKGASVEGDLTVTPGSTLYIEVGGRGGNSGTTSAATAGGANGGGRGGAFTSVVQFAAGGGGASDIRTIPLGQPGSLGSRLMVAGGGGGAAIGGAGGDAGLPGGGGIGLAGNAGTSVGGGAGGAGLAAIGLDGALGQGGSGGDGEGAGGGGGGGLYGGGGGGGEFSGFGGGGGGGSSYTGSATNAVVGLDATGTSSIAITYVPSPDHGTVGANVTVPTSAACLELSTTAIDFGTQRFGAEKQPATPTVTVTNCSGLSGRLLASGTDATGTGATWTLVDAPETCADTLGLDRYRLDLAAPEWLGDSLLGKLPSPFVDLAPGQSSDQTVKITMPCPGSSGGGQTMSMSINYLVVEQ
jgi:glycine rich protein